MRWLYQGYTSPPNVSAVTVPDFVQPEYPDQIHRERPHAALMPALFFTFAIAEMPAPELSWAPVYPDFARADVRRPWDQALAFPETPQPDAESVPELSWRSVYPDIPRAPRRPPVFTEHFWNPETPAAELPDLSWRPEYPDFTRALPRTAYYLPFVWNTDTPVVVPAPDFFGIQGTDLFRAPVFPESATFEPPNIVHEGREAPSRGLYTGPRGLYHSEPVVGEPHALANDIVGTTQAVATSSAVTILVGDELFDTWSLFDPAKSGLVFKHRGYYLVGGAIEFEANTTNSRELRIILSDAAATPFRTLAHVSQPAAPTIPTRFNVTAGPFLMEVGWFVSLIGFQDSGADRDVTGAALWVQRVAPATTILPT